VDIDLRRQLAMTVGADKEMDMRGAIAMATQLVEQTLRGTVGRTAVAAGHDALELIAALVIGDDRAAHIERRLFARGVEVRVKAFGVGMPHLDLSAGQRLAI